MVVANDAGPGAGCRRVGPKTMARLVAYMWLMPSKSVTLSKSVGCLTIRKKDDLRNKMFNNLLKKSIIGIG